MGDFLNHSILPSPIGPICITTTQSELIGIELFATNEIHDLPQTSIARQTYLELQQYFLNPYSLITVPYQLKLTEFEKKVLQSVGKIPVGETRSYSELAKQMNTSARAIGNACRKNPLPLIIPCHRVVAKNHVGGYFGQTEGEYLTIKQWLLRHEEIKII